MRKKKKLKKKVNNDNKVIILDKACYILGKEFGKFPMEVSQAFSLRQIQGFLKMMMDLKIEELGGNSQNKTKQDFNLGSADTRNIKSEEDWKKMAKKFNTK